MSTALRRIPRLEEISKWILLGHRPLKEQEMVPVSGAEVQMRKVAKTKMVGKV